MTEAVTIRCPDCQRVAAHIEQGGAVYIQHRGRRWRFPAVHGRRPPIEFYCPKCEKWVVSLATEEKEVTADEPVRAIPV